MTLQIGLGPDAQDHDRHNLIPGIAFVVLDRRQDFPDDPIPIAPYVNSETALPLSLQGIAEVRRSLQAVEQTTGALDLTVGLWVLALEAPQILPGFEYEG